METYVEVALQCRCRASLVEAEAVPRRCQAAVQRKRSFGALLARAGLARDDHNCARLCGGFVAGVEGTGLLNGPWRL